MMNILPAKGSFRTFLFAAACFLSSQTSLFAQAPPQADSDSVATQTPPPKAAVAPYKGRPVSEVIGAYSSNTENPNMAGLDEELIVDITNIDSLLDQAKDMDAKVLLYINDLPLKDVVCEHVPEGLRFYLRNEGAVNDLWNHLTETRSTEEFFTKSVSISVGIEGLDPIHTKIDGKKGRVFTIVLVRKTWFFLCMVLMLVILILFILLASKSDMLRDTGIAPATGRKPFSLSRVQMGIWFLVVISSWLFLYVCLHRFNLLTQSILILMGITSATGIGGMAMDAGKIQTVPSRSEGFMKDLVTDNNTVSLARFQNFAWTIVLVLVFLRSVFSTLKMPDFDSTLLTLMGISSGTYIGGKVTEKSSEGTQKNAAAAAEQAAVVNPENAG